MKGRRFAALIGLCVAAVGTTAFASGAAAGPAPARSQTAVWTNTSGVQRHVPAAASKEMRALVQQAMRALQARSDGDDNGKNTVYCPGATPPIIDEPGNQRCTFTGYKGTCIQKSTHPDTTQVCKFSQGPIVGRSNVAIALQVIVQRDEGPNGDQRGKQVVKITQRNTNKRNEAYVAQVLKQTLGKDDEDDDDDDNGEDDEFEDQAAIQQQAALQGTLPDFAPLIAKLQSTEPATEGDELAVVLPLSGGSVTQTQNSQQTVRICQGGTDATLGCMSPLGMSSNNLSAVYQSLRQREKAKHALTITQEQNPDPGECDDDDATTTEPPRNMCAIVDQNTTGGKNASGVAELYRQFQSGAHTTELTQQQDPDPTTHGLDHDIHQLSDPPTATSQRNWIWTFQLARQVQRAKNAGIVDQLQDPRTAKGFGSNQFGSTADTWFGRMFADQIQTIDGMLNLSADLQQQLLTYDGDSTGKFDVFIRGRQNAASAEDECVSAIPGDPCHIFVECFGGEGNFCNNGEDLTLAFLRRE